MLDHIDARAFARAGIDADTILADPNRARNRTYARRLIGILKALGYPEPWQHAMIGFDPLPRGRRMPDDAVAQLLRLLTFVGDRWATPQMIGFTAEEIRETQIEAYLARHYPPATYDELFDLVEGAVLPMSERFTGAGPRLRSRGGSAERDLHILALRVDEHLTSAVIAEQLGISSRTVDRILREVGLSCTSSVGAGRVYFTQPDPGQDDLVASIRAACRAAEIDPSRAHECWLQLVAAPEAEMDECAAA